jgi:hypothetical protein
LVLSHRFPGVYLNHLCNFYGCCTYSKYYVTGAFRCAMHVSADWRKCMCEHLLLSMTPNYNEAVDSGHYIWAPSVGCHS